ncbi:MAG: acyl-CoA dehydrogenase family protein [Polyangiales bacterium]
MLLELSSEQDLFTRTTARFLDGQVPVTELRRLRDDPVGFGKDYWRRGAELGWTSLLVPESHGGVAVSDSGLIDLSLVAFEFGKHAAPGPLLSSNVIASTLALTNTREDLIAGLLEGTSIAGWAFSELPPNDGLHPGLEIRVEGNELVLNGIKRPVESAAQASFFLVTGRTGSGLTQVVVPADTQGVSVVAMRNVDLTRRFGAVKFENVRLPVGALVGDLGAAAADVERQLQQALVVLNAEAVGAMQRGFDMTVEWSFDRYSFGRPLASYQALKHRFAQMATWLQASHAISDEAARAVASDSPDAGELVSAAKAYIGQNGVELLQDCVQMHGGIGVTYEHDLHLYLRRGTLNRALLGTSDVHYRRVANFVAKKEAARG